MFSQASWELSQDISTKNNGTSVPLTQDSQLSLDPTSLTLTPMLSQLSQMSETSATPNNSQPIALQKDEPADPSTAAHSILEMSQTTFDAILPSTTCEAPLARPPHIQTDTLENKLKKLEEQRTSLLQCYYFHPHLLRTTTVSKLHFTKEHFGNDLVMLAFGIALSLRANTHSFFCNFQTGIRIRNNLRRKNAASLDTEVEISVQLKDEVNFFSMLAFEIGKKNGKRLQLGPENLKKRFLQHLEMVYVLYHLIQALLRHVLPPEAINPNDCLWFLGQLMVSCRTENECFESILKVALATQTIQQSPLLENLRTLWGKRTSSIFLEEIQSLLSSLFDNHTVADLHYCLEDSWGLLERAGLRTSILVQQCRVLNIVRQQAVNVNPGHYFTITVVAKALNLCLKHPSTQGRLLPALHLFQTHTQERKKRRSNFSRKQRSLLSCKRPVEPPQPCLLDTHSILEQRLDSTLCCLLQFQQVLPIVHPFRQCTPTAPIQLELESLSCLKVTTDHEKADFFRLWQVSRDIVVTPPTADNKIYSESVKRLKDDWLRDDLINAFFKKLCCRVRRGYNPGVTHNLCWFFTSYFFTRVMNLAVGFGFGDGSSNPDSGIDKSGDPFNKYQYANVEKWAKRLLPTGNLFLLDTLAIPVNFRGIHWMLCVVYIQHQKICIYDSLLSHKYDSYLVRSVVFQYILDEYQSVHGQPMSSADINKWRFANKVLNAPQQRNTRDCGVLTVLFGEHLEHGMPLDILQEELKDECQYKAIITRCRLRMATMVLKNQDLS
ncbi:unnamed protein product [Cylindrotheca closterium]|uniref:Ubiquitin-like protease family profile domain-containing protein n=1 Tax=Cylindrotheca closterium TaxID=2856 RepID=A0AAD2G1W4_9STRA|nr:unnamed protein product [Cylindrotheca closterium]